MVDPASVGRAVRGRVGSVKAAVLAPIRRGRPVAWTPSWMRLGNQLGLGLWAYRGRQDGQRRWVLHHRLEPDLITLFPVLQREHMLRPENARITDRRLLPWTEPRAAGPDWELLDDFIAEVIIPESPVAAAVPHQPSDALVVNVRRGDYYSVAEHRAVLGINIGGYVTEAVQRAVADEGVPPSILVVSDDSTWCRDHLDAILAPVAPVTYRESGDPAGDLRAIIHAQRLIIPNSTFSAWGGYIGDVLHPGRAVYAPGIFMRGRDGGANRENASHWTVIDEIPGGWDPVDSGPGVDRGR